MEEIIRNIGGLCAALRHQYETDWLGYQATPQQFAEALYWEREALAGRHHPAYA